MRCDPTKDMPNKPSFEDQVLSRLDAIDARLTALETQSQQRALDTKPIWERALAEIVEVKQEMRQGLAEVRQELAEGGQGLAEVRQELAEVRQEMRQGLAEVRQEIKEGLRNIERKLGVLSRDVIPVRADQEYIETRIEKLEPKAV